MWHERTSPLDPTDSMGEKRGKIEREEGRINSRVRSSHFSLDFSTIRSSNLDETRSEVYPHYKSYAWVPVLWSFDKLQEVGVFSYLFYSLAKSHFNGWGCLEAWMSVFSVPKDLDLVKKSLESFSTVPKLIVDCMCCLCVAMFEA